MKELLLACLVIQGPGLIIGDAVVTSISPDRIGYGGGTININGDGFATDGFSQFDPKKGNKVIFSNELTSVECQNPINWNFLLENPQDPSPFKITCDMPPRPVDKGSNWYSMTLKVDGVDVTNSKSIEYRERETPYIRSLPKRYGRPGDLITLVGRLFTKEYGNANWRDDAGGTLNRREESITGVIIGDRECELTDSLGNVYGMFVDGPDTNEGNITCKPGGTFIGPRNATIVVSGKHGKSIIRYKDEAYSVNSKGDMFVYHTLPELTSVWPNIGGVEGGTYLKIKGNSFDSYQGMTEVTIGNTKCDIVEITNEELTCSTPPQSATTATDAGARGLKYEMWISTEGTGDTPADALDTSAADYRTTVIDGSTVNGPLFGERNGYTAKLSGYIVGPYDGDVSFNLHCSDFTTLYISNNTDPANKRQLRRYSRGNSQHSIGNTAHRSEKVPMVKGALYYIEANHVQRSSQAEENFLQLALWLHNTAYHYKQTKFALDEIQQFHLRYSLRLETQRITLSNMNRASEIVFTQAGNKAKVPFSTLDSVNKTQNWAENFDKMLTVQCNYLNTRHFIKQDYEDPSYKLNGAGGHFQTHVQAYCGKTSLERDQRITHEYQTKKYIDALKYKFLCFAAKGSVYRGRVQVLFRWKDTRNRARRDWIHMNDIWTPSDDWSHQCVDWAEKGMNESISWIAKDMKAGSYLQVEDVLLPVRDTTQYYWMDEITISETKTEIERIMPAVPNENVIVQDVKVEPVADVSDQYDLEINPLTCLSEEDDIPLFGIDGAEIQGLNFDGSSYSDAAALAKAKQEAENEYLKTHENVTFTSSSWGAGTVTIERMKRGSRGLKGSYSLSYMGKTVENVPVDMTTAKLRNILETEFGMVGVTTYYWGQRCNDLNIPIYFENAAIAGDIETIKMNTSNLIVDNDGGWTHMLVKPHTDGGHAVMAPGGDFFRLKSTSTVVDVKVNGFLSSCGTKDCSFSFSEQSTPELLTVANSLDGDGNVVLTISGSKLSKSIENYVVKVGDQACQVTAATESQLVCNLSAGPAGTYGVTVVVKSKGQARQPSAGALQHIVSLQIVSSTPSVGSLGGGTLITVTGTGFPGSVEEWQGGSVVIAGSPCKITESTYNQFICITSVNSVSRRRKRSASQIEISFNGNTATGGSFTYDSSVTPTLSSISPVSGTPLGGGILTITGSALGAKWGRVLIGDQKCKLLTWMNTQITCIIPKNTHGQHTVFVSVADNGYADTTGVSKFTVDFKVTDVTPRVGSNLGGTRIRIEGKGFGNCSDVSSIKLGNLMICVVDECSDAEILCTTKRIGKVITTDNGGKHPQYGLGYVWNPKEITIQPGDSVQWLWTLTTKSSTTGINVHQTDGPSTNEYNGKGFSSGEKKASGGIQETFTAPGTYYFSSDSVFGVNLFMPGKVTVVGDASDTVLDLEVNMTDISAFHDLASGASGVAFTQSDCAVVDTFTCAADPTASDKLQFKAATCLTPEVTALEISSGSKNASVPSWGFEDSQLTITGTGFSGTSCQNQITIGNNGHKCVVTGATPTSLVCNVKGNPGSIDPLESLKHLQITVNILNQGKAIMNLPNPELAKFKLYPKIVSSNLVEGSWAGGSVLTLSGTGLLPRGGKEAVLVIFGEIGTQKSCAIVDVTYAYISCLVPDFMDLKGIQTDMEVPISIEMGYQSENPVTSSPLKYKFKSSLLATVDTMTPTSVTANTPVTITGTNLGSDAANIQVFAQAISSVGRRKRAIREPEEYIDQEEEMHPFWKQFKSDSDGKPIWRCFGANLDNKCKHDSVVQHVETETVSREKRSVDHEEWLRQLEKEDDDKITDEICQSDLEKCVERLENLENRYKYSRRKRSTSEEELIEMALLTEGSFEGIVTAVTETSLSFSFVALPAGKYNIIINVKGGVGNAVSSLGRFSSQMEISTIIPSSGSIHGGQTIKINGGGFSGKIEDTSVAIGSTNCSVLTVLPGEITCKTSACSEACGDLIITSNGISATSSVAFSYLESSSPKVTSASPATSTLTIAGTNFGSNPSVSLGESECTVTSATASQIICTIPSIPGGNYPVIVHNPDLGNSNNDVLLTIDLILTSSTPTTGSFGGGTLLTLTGKGFSSDITRIVTVCDLPCDVQSSSATEITCLSPSNPDTGSTLTCGIAVVQASGSVTLSAAFMYDASLTPSITSATPLRGGTGGGTLVTITGSGYASSGNKVMIAGSVCDIASETPTQITCYTNHHNGAKEAPIIVEVPGQGYARHADLALSTFYYIDRWSSIWTWGGLGVPLANEMIVITEGQTILLDIDTPVLRFLLINGGTLLFDKDAPNIELQAEYILVAGGGGLQIGSEEEPYENKATITMHGNVRCTEMPVFGCKVIGIREGTLDIHGKYIPVTWTHLAQTANAGDTTITLKQPVTWQVGDHIAIATTGDRNSQKENEEHYIAAISVDGYTITLQNPLKYLHISIEQTFGDRTVETRGEVALLTRNVLIRGTMNEQFVETLPACKEEFNSGGAFSDAMQTCFAGKFGEELGSDEMGADIIISPKYKNQGLVEARISYAELTSVGQAFRVGRYPIHFHVTGTMNTSYLRGNSIHHSNNRACTLHDISNTTVEYNVAYNIKGLTFFLEDGVEMYNVIQYNLAIFTRMSNSLLNPDINPASFWIVNPNNKFRHNSCAGGTHLCFWLRPARVPDGPSYTQNFCPYRVPFDEFHNNTAHSMGWYGFWIFGQSNHVDYDPHTGTPEKGYCNGQRTQARIGSFTTWNNKRGFEIVAGANIRLENQTHMDHDFSSFEIFKAKGPYGADGPGIFNTVIVGSSKISEMIPGREHHCTPSGANIPGGYTMENVKFYNFGTKCSALSQRLEEKGESVNPARTIGLEFVNTTNRVYMPKGSTHGFWVRDVDGSLTGKPDSHLVTKTPTNPQELCVDDTTTGLGQGTPDMLSKVNAWGEPEDGETGAICDKSATFHKIFIDNPAPTSLKFVDLSITNKWGTVLRPWLMMKEGWMALLPQDPSPNLLAFQSVEHVTNISYEFDVYGMHKGENYLLLGHDLYQDPDRFSILSNKEVNSSSSAAAKPTYETAQNGDWFFTNNTGTPLSKIVYILSSKGSGLSNWWRKRQVVETERTGDDGNWPENGVATGYFKVIRCESEGCIPIPPPTVPTMRPENALRWSNDSHWESIGMLPPSTNEVVQIPGGVWMILDVDPPKLKRLYIYGALEVEDTEDRSIETELVLIQGGSFIVGREDNPFTHKFELILHGNHLTEDQPMYDAPNCGAKALCVYGTSARDTPIPGFIDMHGVDVGKSWVKLGKTANAGDFTIELTETVNWEANSDIVLSSTSWEYKETEKAVIASVSGNVVTLTQPLQYKHVSSSSSLTDGSFTFYQQAEVGLLTRSVRIIGKDYADQDQEQFGARVLVAAFNKLGTILPGYGRFSNVEFVRGGQEGWSDNFDPRYTLAFMNSGDHEDADGAPAAKESYVRNCGFNYNYNSAIGIFGSNNVGIENNVIFRHINSGILDESKGTKIVRNLVMMGESIAHFKNLLNSMEFYGCIDIKRADEPIFTDNVMAGCAQAGLITRGSPCTKTYTWTNNEIHTSQHGVHLNNRNWFAEECVNVKNFYAWRNFDYGFMSLTTDTVELDNFVLVDNGVGVMTHGTGPSSDTHTINEDLHVTIKNTVIVANSDLYDCSHDELPFTYKFLVHKKKKWSERFNALEGKFHHTGVVMPIFMSKYPKDTLAWHNPVVSAEGSNPGLRGIMYMTNVTFDKFDNRCNGFKDIVIRTNPKEDDVNFPIKMNKIKLLDVASESKVFFNRPLAGKINPADCTDFDCDGMKKAMIWDTDGTFKGQAGTIIPDSAFEWDGSPRRGLGYYRVPKTMVTELNGDKIAYASKMPNTGIYRGDKCSWNADWVAYSCSGLNHRLMILESMDRDTKIRRLAPIAVLADAGSNGFIDLVNGPQDFSCCSGYTCAERLSTFFTMVATGLEYEIVMSSIPPQNFKFHMLHNDGGDAVRVKMWFPKQQRLDVYTEGRYIPPMNKDFSVTDGHKLKPADDMFIPSIADNNCNNYFDPNTGHLYLIVRGPATCDIKTQPVVVLKLGITVDEDEFFNPDSIIGNIAGLLGIPAANIRVTNIVREGSVRRKKRATEQLDLQFEIAPAPAEDLNEQEFIPEVVTYTTPADPNAATLKPSYTTTTTTTPRPLPVVDPLAMDFDALSRIQSKIATTFQKGDLSTALNVTVSEMKMEDPIPPPEEPPAYTSPEERGQVLETTYAEQVAKKNEEQLKSLTEEKNYDVPTYLVLGRQPYEAAEMTSIIFYPYLYVTNANGTQLTVVGNDADPWMVTATLKGGPAGATAEGTLTVPLTGGFANFSSLFLSHEGKDYQLTFAITYPDVSIPSVDSISFDVAPRPLGVKFDMIESLVPNSDVLNATFNIWDEGQDIAATPEVLGSQTWQCSLKFSRTVPIKLVGSTNYDIKQVGTSNGVFAIRFEGSAVNIQFAATCDSPESGRTVTGTSNSFIVFPGSSSSVGLLRKTSIGLMYAGPYTVIKPVVDAFNSELGTLECDGCAAPSTRRRRESEAVQPKGYLDMSKLAMCSMPVCIAQDMSCVC